jgi:hypothetical protein
MAEAIFSELGQQERRKLLDRLSLWIAEHQTDPLTLGQFLDKLGAWIDSEATERPQEGPEGPYSFLVAEVPRA